MAWSNNQTRVCELTNLAAQVGTGGVTGYTVLLNASNLPSEMLDLDGTYPCRTDGTDIEIALDINGDSKLNVDVIQISLDNNPVNSTILIAFGTVSLSAVVTNTFYIAYNGDAGSLGGSTAYNSNTVAFYPLEEGSGTGASDRSSNNYNGTLTNSPTWENGAGIFNSGLEFLTTAHILLPNGVGDDIVSATSVIVAWNHDGTSNRGHFFDTRIGNEEGYDLDIGSTEGGTDTLAMIVDSTSASGGYDSAGYDISGLGSGIRTAIGTYNGSQIELFVDGTSRDTTPYSGTATRTTEPKLGNRANDGDPLDTGRTLLFTWVLDTAIDSGFATTIHNNITNPSSFITAGTPEDTQSIIPVVMSIYNRRRF